MAEQAKATTENNLDLSNFTAELAAKTVALLKPDTLDDNYIYYKADVTAVLVNGVPTKVIGPSQQYNINRGNLATLREQIAMHINAWNAVSAQVDAVEVEMNRLDAM